MICKGGCILIIKALILCQKFYIDKFNNNDEVFIDEYINSLGYFTDYTISNGLYQYSNPAYFKTEWTFSAGNKLVFEVNIGNFTSKYPYVYYANIFEDAYSFNVRINGLPYNGLDPLVNDNSWNYVSGGWSLRKEYSKDGILLSNDGIQELKAGNYGISSGKPVTYEFIFNSNVPFFANQNDAIEAIKKGDFTNALNYGKSFKNADWLQDNWDGELFDPLTGLSYLNDLANMAKHQGLNAIGNDPSLDDMKQHLRDIIANLRPGYDPVTDPSVDPALDPICYPDTIPTPVIDPTADVVLQPAKDPTPSPNPDPSPSTSPKPTTQPTPSPGEIDSSQPVVDLSKFFPFCIPFDLIHLVQALDADPVAPKWTLKLEPPQFPVEWEVTLDLSQFESLAKIFRTGETLLFVVGLILITRGIIKG